MDHDVIAGIVLLAAALVWVAVAILREAMRNADRGIDRALVECLDDDRGDEWVAFYSWLGARS